MSYWSPFYGPRTSVSSDSRVSTLEYKVNEMENDVYLLEDKVKRLESTVEELKARLDYLESLLYEKIEEGEKDVE